MADIVDVEERHSADELRFLRKRIIMIAMDGSKHSEYAFRWFVENLYKKTDEVIMVYCTENFHLPSSALVGSGDNAVQDIYHAHAEEVKQVIRDIDEMAKTYKVTHYRIEHIHGLPGASIVKAAEEQKAGMVICGSRGMGLIRRTIMGSVSDYVLHHTHIPVIVVKHEDEQKKIKTERQTSTTSTASKKSIKSTSSKKTDRQISTTSNASRRTERTISTSSNASYSSVD